ncbi:MAG: sodium/solute symporter [Chromatiaceae bacterium]|nr:sodium:solute symporter [Gammaproteobacteria bacterium]MCP5306306.1 sodium/solute symporter [Chromatiaceae bacterium]MCP5315779.1 sodium/solute symporter [Chromatiaceae bacterium]
MQSPVLSSADLTVVAVYLALVLFIGLRVARRTHTGDDLFLAGRRLGWLPIGFSLFASNISSTTLVGLSGAAYTWGIAVSNYEWMAAFVLIVFAMFFVPYYLNARITTVPEFLECRFDRRSRLYFSAMTLFSNVVVDTAGTLFAGAMVLQVFFPDIDLFAACLGLALVAGLYTAAGGLAAVVYTDVLQAVVLLVGSCIVAWLSFAAVDFSWTRVVDATPPERLSLMLPLDDPNLPWLGTLIGVPVLGFYFWCTNQFIVQRVLGARSVAHARWGALFAGFLKLPVLYLMVIPGVIAGIILPPLDNADAVFPALVTTLLPAGIAGLVMAGLLAAIMSSIDSTLNSAAALLTMDFLQPERRAWSATRIAWTGRAFIVLFMFVAASVSPLIADFPSLFHYLQSALAYLVPPVAVIFGLGLFWRRAGPSSAFVTLIGGHIVSAVLFALSMFEVLQWHFTVVAGVLTLISAGLFVATGLRTARPSDEQIARFTYHSDAAKRQPGLAWWQDYRLHSAILLALTCTIVIVHW